MTHLLCGVGGRSGALLEQPAERRGSDRSDTGASQPHVTDDGGAGTGTEFRPARWEKMGKGDKNAWDDHEGATENEDN